MKQIAIDGPAGAGKSTIAKEISAKLGFVYVDTGAMYRSIALACLESKINLANENEVSGCCETADIEIRYIDRVQHMFLSGNDVSTAIRKEEVGKAASKVSAYAAVRKKLVKMQQELGQRYNVVMDGRDIGTKVLPDADLKIYLTASVECRAQRRYAELIEKGEQCDLGVIKADIEQRDHDDMTRAISPLCRAEDSIDVDSSEMTIAEVVMKIMSLFEERCGK